MRLVTILMIFICIGLASCSNHDMSSPPIDGSPDIGGAVDKSNSNRMLWGLWEFRGDMHSGEVEIIPVRQGEFHLNALAYLEPPPNGLLKLAGPPIINGNTIDVDIALTHPFELNPTFTGFDVKGIIITPGNDGRYPGPFVVMADDDVTHLANPDGYTIWWGPYLFPSNETNPSQGYIDGLLGQPDDLIDYGSNVNAYKYFCDDLGPDDDVSLINPDHRGVFSVGTTHIRHYQIEVIGDTFVFNYAVDASWAMPTVVPPPNVYANFPPSANQPEAYRVEVTDVKNTLYYDGWFGGGDLIVDVKVFTWRDPSTTGYVFMEAPEVFTQVFANEPVETGVGWAKYRLKATACTTRQAGPLFVLIGAQTTLLKIAGGAGFPAFLTAYFSHRTTAGTLPPTDGLAGLPRGIHDDTEWQTMPLPPYFTNALMEYDTVIAVSGNHVVVPLRLISGTTAQHIGYADSLDGGQTFESVPVSTNEDPFIFGSFSQNAYQAAIDSAGGVHFMYCADLMTLGVINYSYTPPGGSPNKLVFPIGKELKQSYPRRAFLLLDGDDRVHIIYIGDGPVEEPFPYRLYEITSSDYVNFTEPVQCMLFPENFWGSQGYSDSHLSSSELDMAGDGEIFLVFKADAELGDGTDIYYSHGFPGAMSECAKINQDIPEADFYLYPDVYLTGKDAYILWLSCSNDQGNILRSDFVHSRLCYIPYDAPSSLITELDYPGRGGYIRDFCLNSWNFPIMRQGAGLISSPNPFLMKTAFYSQIFRFCTGPGEVKGNLLTSLWGYKSIISNSGIVSISGNLNYDDSVKYAFSPIDFY